MYSIDRQPFNLCQISHVHRGKVFRLSDHVIAKKWCFENPSVVSVSDINDSLYPIDL